MGGLSNESGVLCKCGVLTSSYACILALRFALVIIFSGPFGPKSMADALVASENVGDGGPGDEARFGDRARARNERAGGIVSRAV